MITATADRRARHASIAVWSLAAALLLLPAAAMQLTAEVNWTALDFLTVGTMLVVAAGLFELLSRRAPNWTYRSAAAVALGTGILLVWINLAVGIIGSENNDANMMYAGVLTVAVGGACLARLRAAGMAIAMLAAAAVQVLAATVALAFRLGSDGPVWPRDVIGVTAMLTTGWLLAAWLFRRAR